MPPVPTPVIAASQLLLCLQNICHRHWLIVDSVAS